MEPTVEALSFRLERLLASPIDGIFGAVEAGRVVGWVHVQERPLLEEDLAAEVCSLVVLDACRGQGVGRALMAHAEAWARARGLLDVFLRSNVVRKDTHRFYDWSYSKTQGLSRGPTNRRKEAYLHCPTGPDAAESAARRATGRQAATIYSYRPPGPASPSGSRRTTSGTPSWPTSPSGVALKRRPRGTCGAPGGGEAERRK